MYMCVHVNMCVCTCRCDHVRMRVGGHTCVDMRWECVYDCVSVCTCVIKTIQFSPSFQADISCSPHSWHTQWVNCFPCVHNIVCAVTFW